MSDNISFAPPGTASDLEEGLALTPKFDADGLVTCVATDAGSGEVLMVAHMNAEALGRTIATGEAWYFSRARRKLWRKGESSGHVQKVVEMRTDCDQDAVWIKVEQIADPVAPVDALLKRCQREQLMLLYHIPAFATSLADGKSFTEKDLATGIPTVLLFFRGRW